MTCDTCSEQLPASKFNEQSFSPQTCFKCRVSHVNIGFGGRKEAWHGDALYGGTVSSDNRHTVEQARAAGHDPVPVVNRESSWTPSSTNLSKLKTALGG